MVLEITVPLLQLNRIALALLVMVFDCTVTPLVNS